MICCFLRYFIFLALDPLNELMVGHIRSGRGSGRISRGVCRDGGSAGFAFSNTAFFFLFATFYPEDIPFNLVLAPYSGCIFQVKSSG